MSLHKSSVAADHGVVEGDVIIGAGVLPVGEMGGKVSSHHWSSQDVTAQLAHTCDEGWVLVCVLERLTDKANDTYIISWETNNRSECYIKFIYLDASLHEHYASYIGKRRSTEVHCMHLTTDE